MVVSNTVYCCGGSACNNFLNELPSCSTVRFQDTVETLAYLAVDPQSTVFWVEISGYADIV